MSRARRGRPSREEVARGRKVLVVMVLVSTLGSAAFVLWRWSEGRHGHGRRVDPDDLSAELSTMQETARTFVELWSTFQYDKALAVSTGDSKRRVELAIEKERTLSPAEKRLAQDLRTSVRGLTVTLRVGEVVDEDTDRKVLRAVATVHAEDRTVRRQQEFVMVREGRRWKVSSWDPGEPQPVPEGAAEPGLAKRPGQEDAP